MAEDVRGYVASSVPADNAATGRPCAEEPRSKLHQDRMGSSHARHEGFGPQASVSSRCHAEAGASPSSEALPVVLAQRP